METNSTYENYLIQYNHKLDNNSNILHVDKKYNKINLLYSLEMKRTQIQAS